MHSTFYLSKTQCLVCNNEILKNIGLLQGVFGVEIDRIDGTITVNHTDEVSRQQIGQTLTDLGWAESEIENSQD